MYKKSGDIRVAITARKTFTYTNEVCGVKDLVSNSWLEHIKEEYENITKEEFEDNIPTNTLNKALFKVIYFSDLSIDNQ